jgi:aminocarboxymuconate-semialdehyde decarboxylase
MLLPRLQHAWQSLPPVRDALPMDPWQAARRMYYDDLVYDAPTIHRLIEVFGPTQVMAGTDYPFLIMDADPAQRLASLAVPAGVLRLLRGENARRWLGQPQQG